MKDYILEDSLGYEVGRAARTLGTKLNRNFAAIGHDITCEQWGVLVNLHKRDGQSQQELAEHTCKDKTSITRMIDGMEKKDLVVRIPDKIDKRHKLIYLTNKGKNLYKKLMPLLILTLEEAQQDISAKDIETCKDVLRRVYANITRGPHRITVVSTTKSKDES